MFNYKYLVILFFLFVVSCNNNPGGEQKSGSEIKNSLNAQIAGEKFSEFLFVGMVNNKPGIYKYDVNKEEYSVFWYKRYEKVVKLYYSKDRKSAFFITVRNYGMRGVLPFIEDAKIYLINIHTGKVKFLERIGSGIQVFTGWDTKDSFKISLNYIDKRNPHFVHQRNVIFDITGQKILDEIKTFNIIKEGYPKPEKLEQDTVKENYKIFATTGNLTSIFLVNAKNNDTTLITTVDQKLNEIRWSKDIKTIIFSTISSFHNTGGKLANPDSITSKLLIYSLENKRITKLFEGNGIKNFFIINNWVIFDDGFNGNSHINIYNFINLEMIKKISVRGGCGLQNIPQISGYNI
ncbi:MAG: hypothetical protein P8Z35_05670 [Ignavibacteriaceae bacterium]